MQNENENTDEKPVVGGVIKLVTNTDRKAELDKEMSDAATREALQMLEHASDLVRAHGAKGIAIAFVLNDGTYGRIKPMFATDTPALIGSVGTLHHDLIMRTLVPSDD